MNWPLLCVFFLLGSHFSRLNNSTSFLLAFFFLVFEDQRTLHASPPVFPSSLILGANAFDTVDSDFIDLPSTNVTSNVERAVDLNINSKSTNIDGSSAKCVVKGVSAIRLFNVNVCTLDSTEDLITTTKFPIDDDLVSTSSDDNLSLLIW